MSDSKRRLVILAQYDPEGGLPAHVRIHLERLRPIATRLVLVSNSPLSSEARETSERICDNVIVRRNIGWDFAAWRDALSAEDMGAWDAVILTNSSVVGPLYPLPPIVGQMEHQQCDFWGMVQSRQRGPHLQSYFLAFNKRTIISSAWSNFWSGVEDIEDKAEVILRYEVDLTPTLASKGLSYSSLTENPKFPKSIRLVHVNRLKRKVRVPMHVNFVNRTVEFHEELIRAGMPYLKASLLWGKDTHRRRAMEHIKSISGVDYPWKDIGF